ncbi:MAG TPA: DUF6345 domain-containing protein [Dissulfurispiraceae bacterium]|nr:DUF6345 domain-containing protein [Dissulfurispiraceae bacterium]
MYRRLSVVMCSVLAVFVAGLGTPPQQSAYAASLTEVSQAGEANVIQLAKDPQEQLAAQPPIRIIVEIPRLPSAMPLYKLTATRAPVDFLNEKLARVKLPQLRLDKERYVVRSGDSKEEGLRAFIDLKSGDTEFIPNLGEVVKTSGPTKALDTERSATVARSSFMDERFIPKDATELRLAEPIAIFGGANMRSGATTKPGETTREPALMMTIVPAVRYAGGFKVYGLGSHAIVTIDNNGAIIGAVRRWRMASVADRIKSSITTEQVRSEILRQLQSMTRSKGTHAVVDKVEIAYYDNNKKLLQPVYHFEATVQPPDKRISPIRVSGFVPISKPREPIPDLTKKTEGAMPAKPTPPNPKLPRGGIGTAPTPADITLGEYANRDWPNDNGYISMSYSFLNGLTFLNSIFSGWTPPTTRTQWYEAWPWEVVGPSSKYYMNAVNVAYTVPHGDWLINTTFSNYADIWYVPDIGTGGNPGFGSATGGKLATWVIMSCEVIPSFYDRANEIGGTGNGFDAFNAWWGVFKGLHNVIGFRTIMFYPDNDTNWAFGYAASLGGDVNAAWFQEVAAYHGGDGTYASQHLNGNPQVHYDRASTMIDGRNLGQSIFNVGAQSASGTLWNFWMSN